MRHCEPRRDETSRCVSSRALFAVASATVRLRRQDSHTITCEYPSAALARACACSLSLSLSLSHTHTSTNFL